MFAVLFFSCAISYITNQCYLFLDAKVLLKISVYFCLYISI